MVPPHNRNQKVSYPIFEFIYLFGIIHILPLCVFKSVTSYFIFREWLSLGSVFIFWRFICQWLYKFIGEYFNICSLISLKWICCLLRRFLSPNWWGWFIITVFIFFWDDYSWICISSENSFVPHEIVIDKLA